MRLVFVGFGTVARRCLEQLGRHRERLAAHHGLTWRVVGVATARHGAAVDPAGLPVDDLLQRAADGDALDPLHAGARPPTGTDDVLDALTAEPSTDAADPLVVLENTPLGIADGQPGLGHVRRALDRGVSVVTANKGPAAFAGRELVARAERHGCSFLCEGAVLDGLPVFSLVRRTLPVLRVEGFRGIVNTTTNHVLTAMAEGQSLDGAVATMQAAGIAEADPSHDLDGWDAAAKAAALANLLLEASITPADVTRRGLRDLGSDEVARAARDGRRVKLIAAARREAGRVVARVEPIALAPDDPLARLDGTAKGLELETDILGPLLISKPRTDPDHTAYALVSDLVEVQRRGARS